VNTDTTISICTDAKLAGKFSEMAINYGMSEPELFATMLKRLKTKPSSKPIEFDGAELKCNDREGHDFTQDVPPRCQFTLQNKNRCGTVGRLTKVRILQGQVNGIFYACKQHVKTALSGEYIRPHGHAHPRFGGLVDLEQSEE